LIDDQPTLAVGAIALQPGNSNTILVGTGETNNSSDSYYGLGILFSTNGGSVWTQITGIGHPADESFLGIGFSKIAFSTANPNLVVAATAGDNGLCVGEEEAAAGNSPLSCVGPQEDGNSTVRGLYYSLNAGATWSRATLADGSVPASATAVIYNASNATFYAFIRRHGLYYSTDGETFTRLTTQPSAGLAALNCPFSSNATTCLIYRGEFAVVPGRNEMYVWVVDVQGDGLDGNPVPADEGIWQSLNGGTSWTQIPDNGITNCGDDAFGPGYSGCGVEQGWYNLALSAIPDGAGETDIYAGAVNLYKCTLVLGQNPPTCNQSDWFNLTHVYGCDPLGAPAHVHPDQHGIAFTVVGDTSPGYFAHDGGISRTLDGYSGLETGSCSGTNQFDSLSQTLGSMTELVSVSVHPTNPAILLGGSQNNGSPSTSTAGSSTTWQNALGGDGGFTAINQIPSNSNEWFAANPYVTIMKCEAGTECNDSTFFQVVGSNDLGGDQGAYDTPYILDPQNSSEMLVGTCRVWSISTSGASPVQLSNDFETLGTGVCTGDEINLVTGLAAGGPLSESGHSETLYAVTNGYGPLSGSPGGEVWATTDAGFTLMTNVTGNVNPNGYAISSVAMDGSVESGNTAYVGIMGFSTAEYPTSHVWQTTNAGASWTDWSGTGTTALPDAPVNTLLVDSSVTPSQIYAGTDVGVFVSSTSFPPSWNEVDPAPGVGVSGFLPNAPVTALQIFDYAGIKTLVASTYGRGIWYYALGPDFTIAVMATPNTTQVNQNVTWNGTLTAENGYSGTVTLTCGAGDPATCEFTPPIVTPAAGGTGFTVTLGSATPGTFDFTIQGTDGTRTHATPTETLTVTPPADFTIAVSPTPNTTSVNQNVTWNGTLTAENGYSGSVTLSCTAGAPATCEFTPPTVAPAAGGTPFTVTLGSATPGTFSFTIQGTDGTRTHATPTETLTVTAQTGDFTWTDTGNASATVTAGESAGYTFSAAPASGTFSAAVSFTCSGLPALTYCSFSPASIAAGSGTTSVALTVRTTAPSQVKKAALGGASTGDGLGYPFACLGLFGILALGRRGKPRLYKWFVIIGLGLALMALTSCGAVAGGGGGGGTPPGTSNVAVTATESGGTSHGDVVTLIVQ